MNRKLTISEMETAIALIARAIFNVYSPKDLLITADKYYKIVKHLNEIEKILHEASICQNT